MELQKNHQQKTMDNDLFLEIPLESQAFLKELQEEIAQDPIQKRLIERQLAMMLLHSRFFCAALKTTPDVFMQQFSEEDIAEMYQDMLGADCEDMECEDCDDNDDDCADQNCKSNSDHSCSCCDVE